MPEPVLTILEGILEIRHRVGVVYFHCPEGNLVLKLSGLPVPIPDFIRCRVCDKVATVISITDSPYCEECKEGHEIDHSVKPFQLDYSLGVPV